MNWVVKEGPSIKGTFIDCVRTFTLSWEFLTKIGSTINNRLKSFKEK